MKRVEVAIIGGGPAGASCAIELAKHGVYATIFDHSHPREKPCAGGISTQAIEKFPFLEPFRSIGFALSDFKIISYNGIQVMTKKRDYGFCVSRMLFDLGILKMATIALSRNRIVSKRIGNSMFGMVLRVYQ